MIIEYVNDKNAHYYYVMAWKNKKLRNVPDMMETFDIYDQAVSYFNSTLDELNWGGSAIMFEYIGGKRKIIATSEEGFI